MTHRVPNRLANALMEVLSHAMVAMVRREGPDLTARQLGVLLICYLDDELHTVRGLAGTLDISKPAITRSLDRLEELKLIKRGPDHRDARSILLLCTTEGAAFMTALQGALAEANEAARRGRAA